MTEINLFKLAFLVGLIITEVIRAPHRKRNRENRKQQKIADNRIDKVEFGLLFLSFFSMYLFPLIYIFSSALDLANYHLPLWLGIVGVVLVVASLWLLWRAQRDLGTNWSPSLEITEGQKLVTNGVYGTIRHPIYAAVWLFTAAQALLLENWIAGALNVLVYAAIFFQRVPREEQMMLETFGDEYRTYMKRTGAVIPRLNR